MKKKRNDIFKINHDKEKILIQKRFSKQPSGKKKRIGLKPFDRSITGKVGIINFIIVIEVLLFKNLNLIKSFFIKFLIKN